MARPIADLTGHVFHSWTVKSMDGHDSNGFVKWLCVCQCGVEKSIIAQNLRKGASKSCGCRQYKTVVQEGSEVYLSKTKEFTVWMNMRARCFNKNSISYPNYGGRGIKVCKRWLVFENFYMDLGPKPGPGYSIERNDVNGDYEPSNCRWATRSEQARNTRKSSLTLEDVIKIKTMKLHGVGRTEISRRLNLPFGAVGSVFYERTWADVVVDATDSP